MITGLHHVAIAVRDIDATAAFYRTTFGLPGIEASETLPDQGVRAAFIPLGNCRIELLQPLRDDTTVGRYLAKHGEGLHHIGYRVDDCQAALDAMVAAGATPIDTAPRPGSRGTTVAFIHPKGACGTLIELVQE